MTGDMTETSGRAGHAAIYAAYNTGTGTPTMGIHNQFWPIIITFT